MQTGAVALKNAALNLIRLSLMAGGGLCVSAIVARGLGPAQTGLYAFVIWVASVLGLLATLGLPATMTKFVSEYLGRRQPNVAQQISQRILRIQGFSSSVIIVIALSFCIVFLSGAYRLWGIIGALMVLPLVAQEVLAATLAGHQRYGDLAKINTLAVPAQIILVSLAMAIHAGVGGVLLATLGGYLVSVLLTARSSRNLFGWGGGGDNSTENKTALRRAYTFAFTLSYILFLNTIVWQRSEILFLKWYSTPSEIAYYATAYTFTNGLGMLGMAFGGILLPLFSETVGGNEPGKLGRLYSRALNNFQMLMAPIYLFGTVLAAPVVELLYGPSFLPMVPVLRILLIAGAFTCMAGIGSALLMAVGHEAFIAKYGTAVAIINIAFDFILVPNMGAVGAALANCGAQSTMTLLVLVYASRVTNYRFPLVDSLLVYGTSLLALMPALLATRMGLGILGTVGFLTLGSTLYVGVLVSTGRLNRYHLGLARGVFESVTNP